MTTTPTFRVADGMLVENARMKKPNVDDYEHLKRGAMKYITDWGDYSRHLASLRSIPIAPGCVLEKQDGLVELRDFVVILEDARGPNAYAIPAINGVVLCTDLNRKPPPLPTPPARAFSLAEALEICTDSLVQGMSLAKGKPLSKEFVATRYDLDAHLKTYFKQRFNIEL